MNSWLKKTTNLTACAVQMDPEGDLHKTVMCHTNINCVITAIYNTRVNALLYCGLLEPHMSSLDLL